MKCMRRKYFVFSAVSFVLLFLNFSFFQSNILNKDSEVQEYYQNHPKNNNKQVNRSLNYLFTEEGNIIRKYSKLRPRQLN